MQNYGRWIRFDESNGSGQVLYDTLESPLLLYSILLIAVRHTNDHLACVAAPILLREAQQLLSQSLLTVDDNAAFFQAVLILSLWSTTVGQMPLSMDGWLMTNYAIQHALVSPLFSPLFIGGCQELTDAELDVFCIWTHLCLAHLQ